jgi:hypothetical protein
VGGRGCGGDRVHLWMTRTHVGAVFVRRCWSIRTRPGAGRPGARHTDLFVEIKRGQQEKSLSLSKKICVSL